MKSSILIVEDDRFLAGSLVRVLERQGYAPTAAHSVAEAMSCFEKEEPNLVVLDLELPDGDGNEVCVGIRRRSQVPILILSSRSSSLDKVLGLNNGADDYLAKPFDSHEFLARVRAQLRRGSAKLADQGMIRFGDCALDIRANRLSVRDEDVELTATEFRILEQLAQNPDRTLERGQLFRKIWGHEMEFSSNSLEVLVSRIRRKLKSVGAPDPIDTVRGIGYRWRG